MAADFINDPWATLDEILGVQAVEPVDDGIGAVAFYGRCSTEDNQDPETSLGWQLGNARKFVEPMGGHIEAEFFDIGQSRSVPWERRREASRLLAELKEPRRSWNAVVVGEGTRCWFGNQFSLIAPRFAAYGVELWVPELGGRFDPRNPSHKMLMSVLGGMSESERQHVQARVRAAMDAQVLNEGRHQGGRAPYGYVVTDAGPHPNPRKAAEGFRLRVLVPDESADVVRRIFEEYLNGKGDRAIANGLNRDGVPCPSARRPDQNRHRLADGWQGSTIRSILENPRYTGYAFFGRWSRQEMLLNPDDVAAGNVTRFRRAAPDRVVRSRKPAHPKIVSVEDFTEVQLLRRSRAAGGLAARRKLERGPRATKWVYAFRGRVRCGHCLRKMEGTPRESRIYYRCAARTLVPGSPALAEHPKNVYLPEAAVIEPVNGYISQVFSPEQREKTVLAMLGVAGEVAVNPERSEEARRRLSQAKTRLARLQEAIEAGADPGALIEPLNRAKEERDAAEEDLARAPAEESVGRAELEAMVDAFGELGRQVGNASPRRLQELYGEIGLEMVYNAKERTVDVTIRPPRRVNACVRGGT
ncbi:recombinase family protein [Amycolatopsis thailandensis]|uniref:Recombinase family protein n=1 Tax=Amycolatopsis thailandensis TaxID=589330 RepID=A0A229RVB4_9PSEU|nr:recombinase family protein [Amycolatopsis thailandensis]OXM50633.1 recombinase family protein [Amycolatopsis thailandensis]